MTSLLRKITVAAAIMLSFPAHATDTATGIVNRVVDGDTLHAVIAGKETTVRLAGIDAPEARQPYGATSTARLSSLTLGKECSFNISSTDRYGRKIAFIICDSNITVNEAMVGSGSAWVYRQYAKHCQDDFAPLCAAERDAKEAKTGLWGTKDPIEPWYWRMGYR